MNWTAQQKIRIGYWLLTLVPIVLGALAARNAIELNAAAKHVAETNRISKLLEKLFSEIKDVEVAQREYVLVGGEQPLQTIRNTHVRIDDDIRELRRIGADTRWLSLLDSLIPQKFEEIQQTIESRNERGVEAASQILLTNRGFQAMDDIRRVVSNMRTEEERRLAERSREQSRRFQRTFELFFGVLILNLALIGILYFLQRRETERAKQLHDELEQRVALRTEALQRSNEDLQQFAYIASHDMKEPLRMIASYTTLLQRRYAGRLDEDADSFINFIVDGVKRMNTLIQDLLEYSRAASGAEDQLSEVHVPTILRNVMANLKVTIAESGATVKSEHLPEAVPYDAIRLTQIFQNLIGNAIKYRGDRRPVVTITSTRRDDEIVFSVSDNGIGIAPEHVDKIFNVFQRLHGKEYEGTGIGLAMVKKIVERYGGRIWVESTPDVGSTFHFTILLNAPLSLAEAAASTIT
ncbi:MAG TPA: ATP-binding protein [Bryobacteraceae bacterium]|nr:ATP-binding protein [Bryobacteraceae bacterium]